MQLTVANTVRRLLAVVLLVGVLAGTAWALVTSFPWEFSTTWFNPAKADSRPVPVLALLTDLVGVILAAGWALTCYVLLARLVSGVLRIRIPVPRLAMPLHHALGSLLGVSVIASAASPALAATVAAHALATPQTAGLPAVQQPQSLAVPANYDDDAQMVVTVRVGQTRHVHIVRRGEYLSKIARDWLGDARRWPEICRLNRHRHFPKVGGTLRDCNIIYPGWDLVLPHDARPPHRLQPTKPAPHTKMPTLPPDTTTVTPPTVPAPHHTQAMPSVTPTPGSPAEDTARVTARCDERGVQIPGSGWVPWALAAALTAAASVVWLQRRRRYLGEPDTDPHTELPPPIALLRQAITGHPELSASAVASQPYIPAPLLADSLALDGDGAHAAARAAIISVLASGDPDHPDAKGEVIIDTATFGTLFGTQTDTMRDWPRLHITTDLSETLNLLETQILHRTRILDEHSLSDLDTLRQQAPDEEAMPPLLIVGTDIPPTVLARTDAVLTLGAPLRISALWLDDPSRTAVQVSSDGHIRSVDGTPTETVPARLAVLEAAAANGILHTLREAHTGEPTPRTAATTSDPSISDPANPADAAAPQEHHQAHSTSIPASAGKARLRVLGPPGIEDITAPGRPLRAKALEMAVFLACHPDGASTRDIGEYLEPDARLSQADQRVHTNASNLRHNFARTTHNTNTGYVIKTAGRYRLDPNTVEVDVWELRDLLRHGSIATSERRHTLLQQACDLYTGPLADGHDYEWITAHRETVRRWGTEAHLLHADDLLGQDPQAASDLLDKAITLDPYNEELYRKAMLARHALGDTDGIRALLRALSKSLADLDTAPRDETLALATQLRGSLERR